MKLEPRPRRISLASSLLVLVAAFAPVGPALARPAAKVGVSASDDGVRIVVTHSEPVAYTIESSGNRIRVRYADPIDLDPSAEELDNPIVQRFALRDERVLMLYLGPAYERHDSFELREPFRLVLDLQPKRRDARRDRMEQPVIAERDRILVVDPGHGGVEHGAVGPSGLMEKNVTLLLARELERVLEESDPRITVVLTRDEDRIVGLDERTAVANHNKADLFLSIHLNASPRATATGAETYYLSTEATDSEARALATQENRSADGARSGKRAGDIEMILWDMAQNQHLAASSALAQAMQRQLNQLAGSRNRGVRQAPFRVLMGATMPAILVEVGFISNPDEEARFGTTEFRAQAVRAMAGAVAEFLRDLDRVSLPVSGSERPSDAP